MIWPTAFSRLFHEDHQSLLFRDVSRTRRCCRGAATAHDVFEQTRLRHGSDEPNGHCKVAINDHMADWDTPVNDGDTVLLFPPVAGG
jgi:hypothetical protein